LTIPQVSGLPTPEQLGNGMSILNMIRLAFSAPQKIKRRSDLHLRRIVASRSHGNLRLQRGEFYTQADVDAKYDRYKFTRFSAGS
jgi:hypothetical protein